MLRKRVTRQMSNRYARFHQLASSVQIEMLENRVLLSSVAASPDATIVVPTPVLPTGNEPLQGVVGTPNSLDPFLFDSAYGFNSLKYDVNGTITPGDGAGQTIAIVDAYGSPTIVNDAETFDAQWGLSNTDSTGQFFLTVKPLAPTVNTIQEDSATIAGWGEEASLDVEWAHAVAPEAHILLVEAPSPELFDLLDADVYGAAQTGVVAVSNSWGIPNSTVFPNANFTQNEPSIFDGYMVTPTGHTDSDGLQNAGVAFFASTGDDSSLEYPSTSINDIAVGGFTQDVDINGGNEGEAPWTGSGGGSNPNYVTKYNVGEVALEADPQTGVWVYDSTSNQNGGSGWQVVGGTSLSSPAWAAYMSIIDQGLELQGIPSLSTSQALNGGYSYTVDPTNPHNVTTINAPLTQAFPLQQGGLLYLAEYSPSTANDFDTYYNGQPPAATSYPLWGQMPMAVPDYTKIPDAGNTGFGSPNAFLLTNDMVGGGITQSGNALDVVSFATQPVATSAGQAIPTFTVDVENPNLTINTSYNGPVTVSLDPLSTPGAVLSGIVTVNAVNGVATFSGLSVLKIGTFVLDASATNAQGATSNSFQTIAAAAGQLAFADEPVSTWQFGKMPDLVVNVEDQFGNIAATNNSTVTLSIASGPVGGTITGSTTATAVNGVATFSGLLFSVAGTYTLLASDGALTPVDSSSFNIVPIPTPLRYTFNGAALSGPALRFEQLRNAPLFTSESSPSAAQIAAVAAANNNLQVLASQTITPAAVVRVAPSTFSAAVTPIAGSSDDATTQLLDSSNSGVNKLLDN